MKELILEIYGLVITGVAVLLLVFYLNARDDYERERKDNEYLNKFIKEHFDAQINRYREMGIDVDHLYDRQRSYPR